MTTTNAVNDVDSGLSAIVARRRRTTRVQFVADRRLPTTIFSVCRGSFRQSVRAPDRDAFRIVYPLVVPRPTSPPVRLFKIIYVFPSSDRSNSSRKSKKKKKIVYSIRIFVRVWRLFFIPAIYDVGRPATTTILIKIFAFFFFFFSF